MKRDNTTTMTGPELAADREPPRFTYTSTQTRKTGAVAWFNARERHAAGELPNAMELAMAKAVRRG